MSPPTDLHVRRLQWVAAPAFVDRPYLNERAALPAPIPRCASIEPMFDSRR
jgi:hypothetical protein